MVLAMEMLYKEWDRKHTEAVVLSKAQGVLEDTDKVEAGLCLVEVRKEAAKGAARELLKQMAGTLDDWACSKIDMERLMVSERFARETKLREAMGQRVVDTWEAAQRRNRAASDAVRYGWLKEAERPEQVGMEDVMRAIVTDKSLAEARVERSK